MDRSQLYHRSNERKGSIIILVRQYVNETILRKRLVKGSSILVRTENTPSTTRGKTHGIKIRVKRVMVYGIREITSTSKGCGCYPEYGVTEVSDKKTKKKKECRSTFTENCV